MDVFARYERLDDGPLHPLRIGCGDRVATLHFLSRLSDEWKGFYDKAQFTDKLTKDFYDRRLDITSPHFPKGAFRLRFNRDFTRVALYFTMPGAGLGLSPQNPQNRIDGLDFVGQSDQQFDIRTVHPPNQGFDTKHPYLALMQGLFNCWNQPYLSNDVRDLFPRFLLDPLMAQKGYDANRAGIEAALHLLPGWVRVWTTQNTARRVPALNDHANVFGLTWVLPWAIHILTELIATCAITDATFRIMKPYACEILNLVIANETIPIAISVFPTETEESYVRMYDHVEEILTAHHANPNLLTNLRLVSDQHPSLRALVNKKKLVWKFCHRHLIENAGAGSTIGEFVRRLLECSSYEEALRVQRVINIEIEETKRLYHRDIRSNTAYSKLQAYFDDLEDPRSPHLAMWARWERLGCPTTTNGAESVHAKLNREVGLTRSFPNRLQILKDHAWKRFEHRNYDKRRWKRSVNQYHRMMPPGFEHPTSGFAKGWWDFYLALHSLEPAGRPCQWAPRDWLYSKFDDPTPGAQHQFAIAATNPKEDFPKDWKKTRKVPRPEKQEVVEEEEEEIVPDLSKLIGDVDVSDECIPLSEGLAAEVGSVPPGPKSNKSYTRIGWNLVHMVRRLYYKGEWTDDECRQVIADVFSLGAPHEPSEGADVSEDGEGTWRVEVIHRCEGGRK
jgi:hypothetical protein